jgi:hypothetical protein
MKVSYFACYNIKYFLNFETGNFLIKLETPEQRILCINLRSSIQRVLLFCCYHC